jgi:ribosomal protein L7/L12
VLFPRETTADNIAIMDPVDRSITEDERAEIVGLLKQNRFIEAIKLYRDITGARLADAKAAVEAIEKSEGIQRPKRSSLQELRGALIVLLAALGALAVVWALMKLF